MAFFVANAKGGIFWGTGVFMTAMAVALPASWRLERRLPMMGLVTTIFVMIFGGLTLYLQDELFIQIKATIVYTLFALILFGGLAFKRALLKPLMQSALQLQDEGWRILTLRWAVYFLMLAVVNEVARRELTTDQWVAFKTFGILTLTFAFMLAQVGLLRRYELAPTGENELPGDPGDP